MPRKYNWIARPAKRKKMKRWLIMREYSRIQRIDIQKSLDNYFKTRGLKLRG